MSIKIVRDLKDKDIVIKVRKNRARHVKSLLYDSMSW